MKCFSGRPCCRNASGFRAAGRAFGQVRALDVRRAFFGLGWCGDLRGDGDRRHGAQARRHVRDFADTARHLACKARHGTAAAVIEDEDVGHRGQDTVVAPPGPRPLAAGPSGNLRPMEPPAALEHMHQRFGAVLRDAARPRARAFVLPLHVAAVPGRPPVRVRRRALSFTTVFALVPLSMVVFGICRRSRYSRTGAATQRLHLLQLRASSARCGREYLQAFPANTGKLTTRRRDRAGVSLLITLNSVESDLQPHLAGQDRRAQVQRFLVYWTVLTLGALVAATSLALSARFFALP
jgi:hypothetical protein